MIGLSLIAPFKFEEVRMALFTIDSDKAAGPDEFGSSYFKSSWHIVGADVFDDVHEFFTSGRLLKQWNHTVIALVPKSNDASSINDYRPISRCTIFYKIISKVLVEILKTMLKCHVDSAHAASVEGRSIVDNIHLAQERLIKYARKRGSPCCTLKVDIQKAYDTVD